MHPFRSLYLTHGALLAISFCLLEVCGATTLKEPPFPTGQILIVAAVAIVLSSAVAGLTAWKHELVEHTLETAFEKIGSLVGQHPVKVLAGTFLFAVLCSSGIAMQEAELDPGVLWVPQGALALDHRDYVDRSWPSNSRPEFLAVIPESGEMGANMLTPAVLQAFFRDDSLMMATVVDGNAVVALNDNKFASSYGGNWTYDGKLSTQRKCFEFQPGQCARNNILAVFGYDATIINGLTPSIIVDRINKWDNATMYSMVPGLNVMKTFQLNQVLGGVGRDANGNIISAEILKAIFFSKFEQKEVKYYNKGQKSLLDPILMLWDAEAVCMLGFVKKYPLDQSQACTKPPGVKYVGIFTRSFADEFGEAIRDDVSKIIIAYYLMVVYLFVNLGKRDMVHTMQAMSLVCILCIGLAYSSSSGLGGFFQVRTNPLNNNIPFLLLGLGVDDSFVLASEFVRHSVQRPDLDVAQRIAKTAQSGGLSILVTSVTDALAFLIGASTVLPALSAFCIYAGLGVIFCFLYELCIFLPCLAINAWRTDSNRYDCLCCIKATSQHDLKQPQGCCPCIPGCVSVQPNDNALARILEKFGNLTVIWLPGKIVTLLIFFVAFVLGIVGITQMRANFKIEWFFPGDSPVKKYLELNDKYFNSGVTFNVYTTGLDMFEQQGQMNQLSTYLQTLDFTRPETINNWWLFRGNTSMTETNSTRFWNLLWQAYQTSPSQGSVQWKDNDCNVAAQWANCNPVDGIAHARIPATLKTFEDGAERFKVMYTMREDIKTMFNDNDGKKAFPYDYEFLFWEEIGVIAEELIRNLIIAGGIIVMIISLLIPNARIACLVALNIVIAIVEVVGFSHFWGLTFNGISTIYFLICIGLAVDYSAHIAHTFKCVTEGKSSSERSVIALTRIGPSVFHALFSTILAVIVIGFSKSFVFEVFFKILFLVTIIAGSHGIWLLPVLLSLLGGDVPVAPDTASDDVSLTKLPEDVEQTPVVTTKVSSDVTTPVEQLPAKEMSA